MPGSADSRLLVKSAVQIAIVAAVEAPLRSRLLAEPAESGGILLSLSHSPPAYWVRARARAFQRSAAAGSQTTEGQRKAVAGKRILLRARPRRSLPGCDARHSAAAAGMVKTLWLEE